MPVLRQRRVTVAANRAHDQSSAGEWCPGQKNYAALPSASGERGFVAEWLSDRFVKTFYWGDYSWPRMPQRRQREYYTICASSVQEKLTPTLR